MKLKWNVFWINMTLNKKCTRLYVAIISKEKATKISESMRNEKKNITLDI